VFEEFGLPITTVNLSLEALVKPRRCYKLGIKQSWLMDIKKVNSKGMDIQPRSFHSDVGNKYN